MTEGADSGLANRPSSNQSAYRFAPGAGWAAHLFKSAVRQDHAHLYPVIRQFLQPDGIAIDVGAHGGQVTRLLASLVPLGFVLAVEPSGYARSVLRPALWLRRVRNAGVFAGALGATEGVATLVTPVKRGGDVGYGLGRLGGGECAVIGKAVCETVAVTRLDTLVAALRLVRLDFIKVDIEGHEAAFVEGGLATLTRFRPVIMMEVDDTRLEHDRIMCGRIRHA